MEAIAPQSYCPCPVPWAEVRGWVKCLKRTQLTEKTILTLEPRPVKLPPENSKPLAHILHVGRQSGFDGFKKRYGSAGDTMI